MAHIDVSFVTGLLDTKQDVQLRKLIKNSEIPDLAILIDQLKERHKIKFYLLFPSKISSEVLLEVSSHSRRFILKSMKDKYIVSMIEETASDDSADILSEVPEHKLPHILQRLTKKKQEALEPIMKHEEDTAGHLMQSELIEVYQSILVKDAIEQVKKQLSKVEGVNYVYAVDSNHRLKGVVTIHNLFTSSPQKKIAQIMNKNVVTLRPELKKKKVADVFMKEDIHVLPVVNKKGVIRGIVTVDDVLDVIEEEATEDMFQLAGVHPDESPFDPLSKSLKRRLPWLVINLGTSVLAGLTVAAFADTLGALVILAAFLPIIAGMGGNAGTQTLTLIVRGLALNQLTLHNYQKVLLKEVLLGLLNGLITGLVLAIGVYFWLGNIFISLVLLMAMTINLVVAGLIGTSVPIILKRFKVDPAVASSIFLTTFTDVIGFLAYLGIATLFLHWIV
ncbi:magnesium transporter [Candidatus Woesearchaeota archaeon]|nr:magnesium transporter [Candidatus Woesearchaeota archaeon]